MSSRLADGSRRLEDLTEPDERVERRGPEVPADVLTQGRKGLGVPRGAATTRDERVQRCAGGIVDRRFETAVRRGNESEGQLRPELATHPMVRRGHREAQQPAGPAGHRHRLFARAVADPDPDGVAFVDERWKPLRPPCRATVRGSDSTSNPRIP